MKKKDLIQKIKKSAIDEMPDVLSKIDISKINIDDAPEKIKSPFNFRKAVSFTFASLFVFVSGIFAFNFITNLNDSTPLSNDTEIVGFQTVSAASLLDSSTIIELSENTSDYSIMELSETTTEPTEDILNQLNLINNYLNMAETVLVNENQYLYESMDSDNVNFAYAFKYNGTDLVGNLITYTGYYNIITENNRQIENGILIHDRKIFHYSSFVIDNGEVYTYRYRVMIDQDNYVEVEN